MAAPVSMKIFVLYEEVKCEYNIIKGVTNKIKAKNNNNIL